MTEFRIRDVSQNNKIVCFIKSETLILALRKAAFSLDLDITQLYAEIVK
jgi:hypothetical protein